MNDIDDTGDKKKHQEFQVKWIKQNVITNDQRLQDLAVYAMTEGMTKTCNNPQEIQKKFAEYKKIVKRGTFTLEQLEDHVCSVYGIVDQKSNPEFDFLNEVIE